MELSIDNNIKTEFINLTSIWLIYIIKNSLKGKHTDTKITYE